MDETDRLILNAMQSHFPLEERPYAALAQKLELSEEEVINRVKQLKQAGIIRRIGASLDSRKLHFTSTLCAAKVPQEKMELFVKKVNSYSGVTHNYLRNSVYNVWFTFISADQAEIAKALTEIAHETGVESIINLPAVRKFKIKVDFEL